VCRNGSKNKAQKEENVKILLYICTAMNRTPHIISYLLKRKLATALLISVSVAAFATLGDGSKRSKASKGHLLAPPSETLNYKTFSLKSGYHYRGNSLFNSATGKMVTLNTVITYHKGNATYILPLKKKMLLGKVSFKPMPASR
jgi:hypothetical protein